MNIIYVKELLELFTWHLTKIGAGLYTLARLIRSLI